MQHHSTHHYGLHNLNAEYLPTYSLFRKVLDIQTFPSPLKQWNGGRFLSLKEEDTHFRYRKRPPFHWGDGNVWMSRLFWRVCGKSFLKRMTFRLRGRGVWSGAAQIRCGRCYWRSSSHATRRSEWTRQEEVRFQRYIMNPISSSSSFICNLLVQMCYFLVRCCKFALHSLMKGPSTFMLSAIKSEIDKPGGSKDHTNSLEQ